MGPFKSPLTFRVLGHILQPHQHPAVFQALVNEVLRNIINHSVFMYLNDILIFFLKSLAEHENHIRQVLQRLL